VDFVVAGFGLGAVMMLIGFAVRDLGPYRYRGGEGDGVVRRQWGQLCRTVGNAIVSGGFLVCLVTLVLLFADAGDDFGARMVASVSALAVIGSGVWTVFALRRFAESTAGLPSSLGAGGALSQLGPARRAHRSAAASWNRGEAGEEFSGEDQGAFDRGVPVWAARVEPVVSSGGMEVSSKAAEPVLGPAIPLVREVAPVVPTTPAPVTVVSAEVVVTTTGAPVAATTLAPSGAPAVAPGSVFASPLLADVGTGAGADNGSGFRSSVFADIGIEGVRESGARGFSSSVFADLGEQGVTGPVPVVGPEVPEVVVAAEQPSAPEQPSPPTPLPSEGEGSNTDSDPVETVPPLPRKGEGARG
jgi:hypothetical protein